MTEAAKVTDGLAAFEAVERQVADEACPAGERSSQLER